jgi:hypothetical protein
MYMLSEKKKKRNTKRKKEHIYFKSRTMGPAHYPNFKANTLSYVVRGSPYTPLKAARGGHAAHHARPADASGPRPRYSFLLSLSSFFFCFFFYVSILLFQNLKKLKFEKIEIEIKLEI